MDISKIKPDYTLKYIIVGNQAVGKSNIIYRFTQNKFDPQYKATINLDFSYKNIKVKDKIFRIQLWDTVGQESFQSISRGYYKSGVCALVVYDITERESFNDVSNWIEECKNNGPSTISLVLVGNKIDLENPNYQRSLGKKDILSKLKFKCLNCENEIEYEKIQSHYNSCPDKNNLRKK